MISNHIKSRFLEEQVKALYGGSWSTIASSIFIAVVVYFLLGQNPGGHVAASHWAIPIGIVALVRGIDTFHYFRFSGSTENNRIYLVRFTIGATLAAMAWGLYFWHVYPLLPQSYQVFVMLLAVGVASFAASSISYHMGVFLTFLIVIFLPIEIQIISEHSTDHIALAVILALYFLFQVVGAARISNTFRENVLLHLSSREKEQEYKNLQYAVDQHNIVSTTNVKGEIIYANEKMAKLTQYTNDELIGANHRVVKCDEYPVEYWKKNVAHGCRRSSLAR